MPRSGAIAFAITVTLLFAVAARPSHREPAFAGPGVIGAGPPTGIDPPPMDQVMEAAISEHVVATGFDPRIAPADPSRLPAEDSFVRRSYDQAQAIARRETGRETDAARALGAAPSE